MEKGRERKRMAELKNTIILGNIYDPDLDCQYILMRVSAKDWDKYQKEQEEEEP
jgi:hypothetical protein